MVYREVGMWEILDVLRRVAQGQSKSEIKRATGLRRKTIRRYKSMAEELGWIAEEHEPSEELAAEVYEQLRGGGREQDACSRRRVGQKPVLPFQGLFVCPSWIPPHFREEVTTGGRRSGEGA